MDDPQAIGYLAMIEFLENYWKLTNLDEIAGLLGSMRLLKDGTSADPAMFNEWAEAYDKAKLK